MNTLDTSRTTGSMTSQCFSEFFDPVPEVVIVANLDGNILLLNKYAQKSLKIDNQYRASHRKASLYEISAGPRKQLQSYIETCAANRQQIPGTVELKDSHGKSTRFKCFGYRIQLDIPQHIGPAVLIRAKPLDEALGNFSILNKEIELQQRALKNLRQSHEMLKAVLNSLEAIVYVADMETHEIIFINKYCRDAMGDITGAICWQALQKDQTGPCEFCTNKYLLKEDGTPGDPYIWEFQNTINSRWYYIIDRAIQWVDGRIVRLEIATDITKKKETELALKEAKDRWEHTFNAIGLSITILNLKLEIVQANKGACDMFGLTQDEIVGKKCYQLFANMDHICKKCPANHVLAQKKPQKAIITNETTNSVYSIYTSPIIDEKGVLTGIVHIAEDITEKKILEAKLQQAQKMEAIGTLTGGIAHDFNNILMPILGYAEISLKTLQPDDKVRANLSIIKNSALRAKELVQQILTFSRQREHKEKPIYPQQIVKETVKMIRAILPTTIEVRQDICSACPKVLMSPTHLQQIVMNLCTNAYQAMLPKGGVLGISLNLAQVNKQDEKVRAGELYPGTYVLLQVSDTGCGIPQKAINKIFEPYYTTKGKNGGTGLGLAMVHGIVKSYDGHISVYSVKGKGTTFRVYIPILDLEKEHDQEQPETEPSTYSGQGEHIMLIDDESTILDMLQDGLTVLGFKTDPFSDPLKAIGAFKKNPNSYDIVVTDLTMPKITGLEVIKSIREVRKDIPIILCTGFSELMNKDILDTLHIDLFLQKPITPTQLARSIIETLKGQKRLGHR